MKDVVMEKPRLMKQTQSREFFGHHMLLHAAELQLEQARQSEAGRFNNCLSAMTMTALSVEALLNAVGSRAIENWEPFERLRPHEKIVSLQTKLGFSYDSAKHPWDTLRYLSGFRNNIAHAKPEFVEETTHFVEPATNATFLPPQSKLEREITVGNACRCLKAVQALKGILTDALPDELRLGIFVDSWSGSTELA